ncbi:dTDP-4-dehydrorhamnose reductase [Sulfolobus sp. D5]|nr:dTDP-4-dehydrorhamnose reductase [Sulfolobus sp. D5]
MKIAVTDEGEVAKTIAVYLGKSYEVIIVDTPSSVIREKPNVIIHTNEIPMNDSIQNPPLAWTFNTWYAINIARAGSKIGSVNIYLSTFMVYDGKKGYYKEHNTPSPLNYYGLSKLVAETTIMGLGNYLILRLGALFSLSYKGFLYPFIRASVKGKILRCNKNFYLSIISTQSLAKVIKHFIEKDARGVINVGSNRISMLDFCNYLSDVFGNEIVEVNGSMRDFSLDDWLLRAYNVKINSKDNIMSLVEQKLFNN